MGLGGERRLGRETAALGEVEIWRVAVEDVAGASGGGEPAFHEPFVLREARCNCGARAEGLQQRAPCRLVLLVVRGAAARRGRVWGAGERADADEEQAQR